MRAATCWRLLAARSCLLLAGGRLCALKLCVAGAGGRGGGGGGAMHGAFMLLPHGAAGACMLLPHGAAGACMLLLHGAAGLAAAGATAGPKIR
jgi:hypothetical protein